MAENRGNLTSYRPDIKVMDCTLRDGGLVNNFEFTDEFVKDLYEANVDAVLRRISVDRISVCIKEIAVFLIGRCTGRIACTFTGSIV